MSGSFIVLYRINISIDFFRKYQMHINLCEDKYLGIKGMFSLNTLPTLQYG
jgi:hypothetical protein